MTTSPIRRGIAAVLIFGTLAATALSQTPRLIEFDADTVAADEVSSSSGGFGITVTPPLASGQKVRVGLKVADGTARRGEDFALSSDSFLLTLEYGFATANPAGLSLSNWEDGKRWRGHFTPVDDGIHEPDETFALTLSEPGPGAVLGDRKSLTATILNSPPTLFLSVRSDGLLDAPPAPYVHHSFWSFRDPAFIREDAGARDPLEFVVTRRGDREGEVSADLVFLPGGSASDCFRDCKVVALPAALPGVHFQAADQRVSFASGEIEPKRISVPILPDGEVGEDRFFTVRLQSLAGGRVEGGNLIVGILDSGLPAHLDVTHPAQSQPPLALLSGTTFGQEIDRTPWAHVLRYRQPDDSMFIRGDFTHVNGVPRPGLARLDADYQLDETFDPDPSHVQLRELWRSLVLPLRSGGVVLREDSNRLVWLTATGERNPTFPTNVHALFVVEAPNGDFYFGEEANRVGRLNAAGERLPSVNIPEFRDFHTFYPAGSGQPLVVLQDGKLLVTGSFDERWEVRRFFANGAKDVDFAPVPGLLRLVLSDLRLVISSTHSLSKVTVHQADGTFDFAWPETFLNPNGQDAIPGTLWEEIGGQLRITGNVTAVNGIALRNTPTGPAIFYLTNAPKTALQLHPGPEWWRFGGFDVTGIEPGPDDPEGFTVSFRRLGSTKAPATVHYTTRDLSATAGNDYVAQSGTLTFAPFEVEKTITIPILADTEKEWDEILELVITGAEGFEALPPPQRLIIRDPEGFGTLPPSLDRVKRLRDGRVLLGGSVSVDGSGGVIQFSTDLKTWHPLTTDTGGNLSDHSASVWLDASATNAATRFYRAVPR